MPDYEEALAIENLLFQQTKNLLRSTVKALDDDKLSDRERLRLGMQATQLGFVLYTTLEDSTPEERKHLLYVLEHSELVLKG